MKKLLLLLTLLVTAVGSLCAATYNKVTDFSTLQAGDKIILIVDYAQSGSSNPYFLFSTAPDLNKTNVPAQVLDQSTTSKSVGESYDVPSDKTLSEITLVESGNSSYPWLFKITVNATDYYLCCTSTSSKSTMGYKAIADKTSACEVAIDPEGVMTFNHNQDRKVFQMTLNNGKTGDATFNCYTTGSQKKPLIFKLQEDTPPAPPATVGEISVKLNGEDYDLNDVGSLYLGDTFTFTAENAGYMYIHGDNTNYLELTVNDGVAIWTPNIAADYDETVYALVNSGDTNYTEQELMFTVDALGEIVGTATDGQTIVHNGEYTIEEGTALSFSSIRADKITVTDEVDNIVATGTTSVSFTPAIGEHLYFVKAERTWNGNTIYNQALSFDLTVTEGSTAMGSNIVIYYNDEIVNYTNDDPADVYVQDALYFYCKNADHISITYSPGYNSWSVTRDGERGGFPIGELAPDMTWEMNVIAYQGNDMWETDARVERSFKINVKDHEPLGDIIIKANGTEIVYEYDEFYNVLPYEVYPGTEISVECENATGIEIHDSAEIPDGSPLPSIPYTVNVLGQHNIQATVGKIDYPGVVKTKYITITVVEKPEDMEYKLVKLTEDVTIGGHYIITTTTDYNKAISNENKDGNRAAVDVTIANEMIVNPSESVMTFTLEKDQNDWLIKTENYLNTSGEIATPQVYLHAVGNDNKLYASNPSQDNLGNRNASIEIDDNNNAIIKFVNCVKNNVTRQIFYNAIDNTGNLFNCYVTTSNKPVQLYKLDFDAPVFDQIVNDNTKVSFMTPKGELHIYLTERDSEGNIVSETAIAENAPMRAAAADWTNRVAGKNEVYEIAVPSTDGNILTIQAKAVLNGIHSAEVVRYVDANGQVLSGVNAVAADDVNAPVEYYNLQGVRVDGRQPGLYIRRQGSTVAKVLVK